MPVSVLLVNLLNMYADDDIVDVDRSFESFGRLVFRAPAFLEDVVRELERDISELSSRVSYALLKSAVVLDEALVREIEAVSGAKIDFVGERNGYIIKGEKARITMAESLLERFTGVPLSDLSSQFVELTSEARTETVADFLGGFLEAKGLSTQEFRVDIVSDRLIHLVAPLDSIEEAMINLETYETHFFTDRIEKLIEIPYEFYAAGIEQILSALYSDTLEHTFIPTLGLLIVQAPTETVESVEELISDLTPRIRDRVSLEAQLEEERRVSRLVKRIPGWTDD